MSINEGQGTAEQAFDDRDFFEEDFPTLEPGTWTEMPEGFCDMQLEGVSAANAVAIKAGGPSSSYFGLVPRQQLDSFETWATIGALQGHGAVVTLVDAKSGLEMDANDYTKAVQQLGWGADFPYDDPEGAAPAVDWAHAAARGILDDLRDRGGIKDSLEDIDVETRVEIVQSLSDIVRAAFIRRAA